MMAIKIKPSHEGRLHKKLGVPSGKPIPAGKLAKAEKSSSPSLRKEATFAENAKHFSHRKTNSTGRELERRLAERNDKY